LAAQCFLGLGEQRLWRLRGQIARLLVDKEIFLFDADAE
jgi:hypothetical protein